MSLMASTGQINRHKNQQEQPPRPASAPYPSYPASRGRGSPYWQQSQSRGGYASWGGRGRGRGAVPVHHNKTLVINNKSVPTSTSPVAAAAAAAVGTTNAPVSPSSAATGPRPAGPTPDANSTSAAPAGWVAKRDRQSMQLINTSIFDKHVQNRTTAATEALREGLKRKEAREKLKLNRVLQDSHGHPTREITLGGERYAITAGGNKLVKLWGEDCILHLCSSRTELTERGCLDAGHPKTSTPKKAIIGGIQYQRSRNGNLVRANIMRASRSVQHIRLCFTNNGQRTLTHGRCGLQHYRLSKRTVPKSTEPCKYYSTTGQCRHGLSCPYVHDPIKVAICPRYLSSGTCPDGDMCDLSHEPTPHRVPACHHFLRGNCVNPECRYAHIRVNPGAPVCRPFATLGYCPKGAECAERHVYECPEYAEKGTCNIKGCKLQHVEHAGRRRAAAAAAASAYKRRESSDNTSDNDSSDAEENDGSTVSDVDSDIFSDLDIAEGNDDENDGDLAQDFIKL
ncbi:hypothetical protein FN846DRAFT_943755 [Sphaerosporella brunnea]|uniref:C3H1-type domain-containing protein n=1 Tax=Sphaerosporella brunnea TaxID=1250544 RepID=A0A5J5F196_9PEZI|nr:hypothetical protein FN846DRAFT_943755 [Sphaerosporella brunnea]